MDAEEISREMDEYTTSYMKNFSYRTVFVASEKTKAYYTYDGFYKIMDVENDEDDVWYQKFVDSGKKYTVMLGGDEEYPDLWLIYIDVRIEDKEGNLLGVCGVSMELEEIQKQIAKYEKAVWYRYFIYRCAGKHSGRKRRCKEICFIFTETSREDNQRRRP